MEVRLAASPEAAAEEAADIVASRAMAAISRRGRFVWAVSGGSTPARFLAALATRERVDWSAVHLFQVDERIAPGGSAARNDTMIRQQFVDRRHEISYHPMPVGGTDISSALVDHLTDLERLVGAPARLDLVQLGLGTDGHTASLVPDDPVLNATSDLAVTLPYQRTRRVTMTAPLLNRAAERLFLVTGHDKDDALRRLSTRDTEIPASMISPTDTILVTDRPVAERLPSS